MEGDAVDVAGGLMAHDLARVAREQPFQRIVARHMSAPQRFLQAGMQKRGDVGDLLRV